MRDMTWDYLKPDLTNALERGDVDEALKVWTARWELATLQAAALCEVEVTPAMAGRAAGELAQDMSGDLPIPKQRAHLPLRVRQVRRTWSLMKSCLHEQEQAHTFLALVKASCVDWDDERVANPGSGTTATN
eukprot:2479165-Amphidinium_carterae.2